MRNPKVEKLVKMALLCAMSVALMYVVRFPLMLAYLYTTWRMCPCS